jgi:hypothetical protein
LRYLSCNCKPVKETNVKTTNKLAAITALAAMLAAPSLFADNRRQETTDGWRGRASQSRRVTVEGRIRDIDRDRNGFVIRLDPRGSGSDYVLVADADLRVDTDSARRGRGGLRQLERGDAIRATGSLDRGRMYVDRITLVRQEDDRRDRNDRYLSGRVKSSDRRGELVWIEEQRTGRLVAVDVRHADRNARRFDIDAVRRGDRITARGDWQRNGRFEAESVEVDR